MKILIAAVLVVLVKGQANITERTANITDVRLPISDSAAQRCGHEDPDDVRYCYPDPPGSLPDPYVKEFGFEIEHYSWWWAGALKQTVKAVDAGRADAIRAANALPKSFMDAARGLSPEVVKRQEQDLKQPEKFKPDWREYYWQMACPFNVYVTRGFWHKYFGKCYLMYPCNKQLSYHTRCLQPWCWTRCKYFWKKKNSVCRLHNFVYYTRWVFCPWISPWVRYFPWIGYRKVTYRSAQCCMCRSCYYTKNSWITAEAQAASKSGEDGDDDGGMEGQDDEDDDAREPDFADDGGEDAD